jgi:hypothetical protein
VADQAGDSTDNLFSRPPPRSHSSLAALRTIVLLI